MTAMKGIISGVIGAVAFAMFLFMVNASPLLSIIAGGVCYGASFLILRYLFSGNTEIEIDSVSEDFYRSTIKEGRKKFILIKNEIENINDVQIRRQGNEIIDKMNKMFAEVEDEPKKVKLIRDVFTYYLDGLLKILQKFNEISKNSTRNDIYNKTYAQMLENLEKLNQFFDSVLHKLLEDELTDLNVEFQVLNKMLKVEGIEK